MPAKVWTCRDVLAWTASRFEQVGIETARLDAELLLAKALGCDRLNLYTNPDRPLSSVERTSYRELVERRLGREPVAYITGTKPFRYLTLSVDRTVLVPRPETELLVEIVVQFAAGKPIVAADVGTGSGAVAISIAKEVEGSIVWAADTSEQALRVAERNADTAGVGERVSFLQGDMLEPLPPKLAGSLDVVVSNPPYVPSSDIDGLAPEIRDFEPRYALEGGADGLDFHRRLIEDGPRFLRARGMLAMEIGSEQGMIVSEMMGAGFEQVAVLKDLAGLDRVVSGVKRA